MNKLCDRQGRENYMQAPHADCAKNTRLQIPHESPEKDHRVKPSNTILRENDRICARLLRFSCGNLPDASSTTGSQTSPQARLPPPTLPPPPY